MTDIRSLTRLTFAAVRRAKKPPGFFIAERIAIAPELGCNTSIRRILVDLRKLPVFDLPCKFTAKLEIQPLIINRPRFVRRHEKTIVGIRDHVTEIPCAWY
jgi:hypothetical protein